jgi:hypothetical protein
MQLLLRLHFDLSRFGHQQACAIRRSVALVFAATILPPAIAVSRINL